MPYDQFEYYYPMPDDVAQSILLAETESKINLRPTNLNAKKIWLYNKLLKNLLTNRKTIISIDSTTDVHLLYAFLKDHEIENLALFFQHSRSNLEMFFKTFSPVVFKGRLLSNELFEIQDKLKQQHTELQKALQSIHGKSTFSEESLLTLCIKSIKLKQELSSHVGFTPNLSEVLSIKDFHILKQRLEEAISVAKGSDPALAPFEILHDNLFELFDHEEAWLIIYDHIENFKSNISNCLIRLTQIEKEVFRSKIIEWQSKINNCVDTINQLQSLPDRTSQENVRLDLAYLDLNQIIPELFFNSKNPDIDAFLQLNNQQIHHLIFEKVLHSYETLDLYNQIFSGRTKFDVSVELEFINNINSKNILRKIEIPNADIKQTIQFLKTFYHQLQSVLRLKSYFGLYFSWRNFIQTFTIPIQKYFESLKQIPPHLWHLAIEYSLIQKQIFLSELHRYQKIEELQQKYKSQIEHYKANINHHILSKYEGVQHKSTIKIVKENKEFNKLFNQRLDSDYTLSDYYSQINHLSEIFPIIILDNVKEDYISVCTGKVWDEFIDLKEIPSPLLYEKMSEMSYHSIQLNDNPQSDTVFNIALHQSPPEVLKNILQGHISETAGNMKNLVNFIFSNKSKFHILVNSNEFIISFLPIELTKLVVGFYDTSFNIFEIDEINHQVRMYDWLAFRSTNKKIWTLDQMIDLNPMTVQQYGWQKQFIKCLVYAGFEQVNFSSSVFLEIYNVWDFPNQQNIFSNTKESNKIKSISN